MGWLFTFLSDLLGEIPLATLKGITIFPLRGWVWVLLVLRQPSPIHPLTGSRWWTFFHCNSAFAETSLSRGRKESHHLPRETGRLAEPSSGKSEVSNLYNWECNQSLHTCGTAFSFAGNWWILEGKPMRLHHRYRDTNLLRRVFEILWCPCFTMSSTRAKVLLLT